MHETGLTTMIFGWVSFKESVSFDAQRAVQEFGQQNPQALLEMLITSWSEMEPRLADAVQGTDRAAAYGSELVSAGTTAGPAGLRGGELY